MPSRARCLVVLALLLAPSAHAQPVPPREERLYLAPSALLGSARVVALGGAYVGVAEGAPGSLSNLAALAHRGPDLDRAWDAGLTLSWLDLPVGNPASRDLDNDGEADDAPEVSHLVGGLLLQYGRYGAGFNLRRSARAYCTTPLCDPQARIRAAFTTSLFAGAMSFARDELALAFGLYAAEATLRQLGETQTYRGVGLAVDLLYRPLRRPYRLGVVVRPEVVATWRPRDAGQLPFLAGRRLFSAVVSPGVLSAGVSYRLGPGSEHYNRLSPAARRELVREGHADELPPEPPPGPAGPWMIAAQLDLVSAASEAVPLAAFTSEAEPERVGGWLALQPRVAVEHETWPGRLRLRLGAWAEPSAFPDHLPRPHGTGGFELFLFRWWEDWALSGSFDVARRYGNVGLSLGFWR